MFVHDLLCGRCDICPFDYNPEQTGPCGFSSPHIMMNHTVVIEPEPEDSEDTEED
jgi:hypothetical protein